jgi:hypothetical protein
VKSAASEERSPSLASFGSGAGVINRSGSTNYFGGVGVESGAPIVPQRGQCAQATSIGDWQALQVHGAVEVTVAERPGVLEDLLSSSGSAAIPFLNSFIELPSDFVRRSPPGSA